MYKQQSVRVFVADDHPIIRQGLDTALRSEPYIELVGMSSSFHEMVNHPLLERCDVLILDLSGMQAGPTVMVTQLTKLLPRLRIVIFSSSVDTAPELLRAGALGYVAKDDRVEHVLAAVRAVNAGQRYLSPIAQHYLDRTEGRQKQYQLVPKEVMVLKLLAQGLRTAAIAHQLLIDPRTVQNYITSLLRKTACEDRVQLVEWYQRVYDAS